MKKYLLLIFLLSVCFGYGQIVPIILPPPSGMVTKSQLWNFSLTNTTNSIQHFKVQLVLLELNTGQPILTASSNIETLNLGSCEFHSGSFQLISYNIINANYHLDADPNGILPIGSYKVCYSFQVLNAGKSIQSFDQCTELIIPPLLPPVLMFPKNDSFVSINKLSFSWLPPAPLQMLPEIKYDIKICELYQGQTSAYAIEHNPLVYERNNISESAITYPTLTKQLYDGKSYVWKIIAKNNNVEIAGSDVWIFHLTTVVPTANILSVAPYVSLKKSTEDNYAIFINVLKFKYLNETTDKVWKVLITDLTDNSNFVLQINQPLHININEVKIDVSENNKFVTDHTYLLQIPNSRNEVWQMRFQYRKI